MNKQFLMKFVLSGFKIKALLVFASFLVVLGISPKISDSLFSLGETKRINSLSSSYFQGEYLARRDQFVSASETIQFNQIKPGVLGPNDNKGQGRYFDSYQFEGRKNQRIKIKLSGSNDDRNTSNLSLNPVIIEVLDSNNNVISIRKTSQSTIGGLNSLSMSLELPSTDTYKVVVSNRNLGDVGRYTLVILDQGYRAASSL